MELLNNNIRSTSVAKQLVAAVARAFYTDNYVVLFDALTREKFIKFEELAPRLRMSPKDIKSMIEVLEIKEGLIKSQNLTVDGATWKLYYIDYQSFTNIVRYRVHLMQTELAKREAELNAMMFECPSCHARFSTLEAQKLLTKDMKRACPHCCPFEPLSSAISESAFRLFEVNIENSNSDILLMQSKFTEQLSHSADHDGIFNLLAKLKDVPLLRNLPKDNIDHGLFTSVVTDTETKRDIEESTRGKRGLVVGGIVGSEEHEFQIEIVTGEEIIIEQEHKKLKAIPDFLLNSNVKNGNIVMQQALKLNSEREGEIDLLDKDISGDDVAWE